MLESKPATSRAERIAQLLPALSVAALFAALLGPALNPGVQVFYRDTGRLYYPVKKFIAEELLQGHFPLWDHWTESGISLLGQVTPGLLHPFTLLYLLLPFDLAFKLNHLLGLPLAGLGAFLLARRLGTSRWGAAAAAVSYGGCGFLVSMASSNLPYAIGPAMVPFALDGLLRFLEKPTAGRLAWGSLALALPALAGEPQSVLLAGVIGAAYAVVRALAADATMLQQRLRRGLRAGLLTMLWGIVALGLCAPAALPAAARLRTSSRGEGVTKNERGLFLVVPWRFAGYLVPYAFDDPGEVFDSALPESRANPYREYFSLQSTGAFSDSIVIGAPPLLLALLGCFAGRKGRFLFAGALLFVLASAGDTLGIQDLLMAMVPGFRYFRYAEKFAAPATLLFALTAGLGTDFALGGTRRAAWALSGCALGLGALGGGLRLAIVPLHDRLVPLLTAVGHVHEQNAALRFLAELRSGLEVLAALSLTLGLVALLRALRGTRTATALGALCCCASVLSCNTESLLLAPVELLHGPFTLGDFLLARGGPSEDRWRIFGSAEAKAVPLNRALGERVAVIEGISQALIPQFEMLSRIDGASGYFTSPDKRYNEAFQAAPYPLSLVLAVRYVIAQPYDLTPAGAKVRGFEQLPRGYWMLELPLRPHAFVVAAGRPVPDGGMEAALTDPAFSPTTEALVSTADASFVAHLAAHGRATSGTARWSRQGPNRMHVDAEARAPRCSSSPSTTIPAGRPGSTAHRPR